MIAENSNGGTRIIIDRLPDTNRTSEAALPVPAVESEAQAPPPITKCEQPCSELRFNPKHFLFRPNSSFIDPRYPDLRRRAAFPAAS